VNVAMLAGSYYMGGDVWAFYLICAKLPVAIITVAAFALGWVALYILLPLFVIYLIVRVIRLAWTAS
jgi:hypothetical protein